VNVRSRERDIPMRDAAYQIAVSKVAAATEVRGIYP
jgi:glutamate dehydrogenase/leucine dehydrogenase